MKKISVFLFVLNCIFLSSFNICAAPIYHRLQETLFILHENGTASVNGYTEYATSVYIPTYVSYNFQNYLVTEVEPGAFMNCRLNCTITLPNTVKKIGSDAFRNCSSKISLTSTGQPQLEEIGREAFRGASVWGNLGSFNKLNSIGERAFYGADLNSYIVLPNSLKKIEKECFANIEGSIDRFVLPVSLEEIGEGAFSNIIFSTSVLFPNSLKKVGDKAFYNCKNAFFSNLFSSNIESIGDFAFYNCSSFETAEILPETLNAIGNYAFKNSGLSGKLNLNKLSYLGEGAFEKCNISSIIFSENLKEIQTATFRESQLSGWLNLPQTIEKIQDEAFANCTGLTALSLPTDITEIGTKVWSGCVNIEKIYYQASSLLPASDNCFDSTTYLKANLFLPSDQVNNSYYILPWAKFKNVLPYDFSKVDSIVLNEKELELFIGDQFQFKAQTLPIDRNVVWSSSNTDLAIINDTGLLTAVSEGTLNITASCGGCSSKCEVTIKPVEVREILFPEANVTLYANEKFILNPVIKPDNATYKQIKWTSSNPEIVFIEESGELLALSHGEALITAQCGDAIGFCKVYVPSIYPLNDSIELNNDEFTKIEIGFAIENNSIGQIYFSNYDKEILTISADGVITPLNPGETSITIKHGIDSFIINVKILPVPLYFMEFKTHEVIMMPEEEKEMEIEFYPSCASKINLKWEASDPSVVLIEPESDKICRIKALKTGETKLIATSSDDKELTATCKITILPSQISWDQKFKVVVSDTLLLTALSKNASTLVYRSVVPSAQHKEATLYKADGQWFATFPETGIYQIEAKLLEYPEISTIKEFNVLPNNNSIFLNEGIYYSYNADKDALKVVKGPEVYSGYITVPSQLEDEKIKSIEREAFSNTSCLYGLEISEGIECLEEYSFAFSNIHTLILPSSLKNIEGKAFLHSKNLKQIYFSGEDPIQLDKTSLDGIDFQNCILYIRSGKRDRFLFAENWCDFQNIQEYDIIPVANIEFDKDEYKVEKGDTIPIQIKTWPSCADIGQLTRRNSNPGCVHIDGYECFIAKEIGKSTISLASSETGAIAEADIFVNSPSSIKFLSIEGHKNRELKVGESLNLICNIYPLQAHAKDLRWESSAVDVVKIDSMGKVTALKEGKATITASCGELSAYCEITVYEDDNNDDDNETDNNNVIVWDQDFRCALGDIISLQVSNPYGKYITCKSSRPDGGYVEAQVYEENGVWYAYCHSEGMVMIEAWLNDFPDKKIYKTFIVVRDPEELIYCDGLYFRFTDNSKTSLKVCQGFAPYEGDYTIPGNVMGYDVLEIEDWAFYTCKNLGKIMIEDGVKKIVYQSFGNGSIYEIHIPSSVTEIEDWAFNANNPGFKDIYLYGLNPVDVNEEIFNGYVDYERCVLHIPHGTLDTYRSANVWSNFENIVEDITVIKTEAIMIVPESLTLGEGTEYQLQVIFEPKNTMERTLEWKDYNHEIISVTENGLIRGLKKGKTTLTVVCGLASAKCDIEVSSDYDSVSFIPEDENDSFTVINLQGIVLMKNVSAEKLNLLEPGSYIIISEISGMRSKVLISN